MTKACVTTGEEEGKEKPPGCQLPACKKAPFPPKSSTCRIGREPPTPLTDWPRENAG